MNAPIASEHQEDGVLARAHLDGDPEAFAILYRRYYPDLVRYVTRRGADHARAEDVAQETLARAYRYFGGFDPARPVWPWLRTIATRVAAVEADRHGNEVLVDDLATDAPAPGGDPLDHVASRVTLAQAMHRIPLRQRDALLRRYVDDQQPSDIAAAFGLTRTAFEQLLWRARRSLAREYAKVSTALAPLAVRVRRAAAWCDGRLSAFTSSVLAFADVAVGTGVVAVSTIAIAALPASHVTPLAAVPVAGAEPAARHGVATVAPVRAVHPPGPVIVSGPATGTRIDASRSVGETTVATHTHIAPDPTKPGDPIDSEQGASNVPVVDWVHNHFHYHQGSGPGPVCYAAPSLCDIAAN